MNGPLDRLGPADFERLFVDEPQSADPAADLGRGRRLRRRRRTGIGAIALVALGRPAFSATTEHSWRLAVRHLDPGQDHLADYDSFAFTGGGAAGGGIQVGQKIGWTVEGDPGEGMIQLAVTRLTPGAEPRLGRAEGDGLCTADVIQEEGCRRTTVAGIEVYLGTTADGGFVMDRLQDDGEVASIIVDPLSGNNTEVPLRTLDVTRETAAALLDDPALDVIG